MKIRLTQFLNMHSHCVIDTTRGFSREFLQVDAVRKKKTAGWFHKEGENLFMMFAYQDSIYLFYNDKYVDAGSSGIEIKVEAGEGTNRVSFYRKGELDYTLTYKRPIPVTWDPAYVETDEDADFFLWAGNVLASPERRGIFLEHNS